MSSICCQERDNSTVTLAAGCLQIKIDEASQEKTSFITHQGLFKFRVMPFGLTNAPSVFW